MLRIQVTHYCGRSVSIAADFDELGGTIGRSAESTLVLPDEKRYISRVQASITFKSGTYFLSDQGSGTPTLSNGRAVGHGNEVALRDGDELRVGDYTMRASIQLQPHAAAAALPEDPFADLASSRQKAPRVTSPEISRAGQQGAFEDPFALPASAPAAAPSGRPDGRIPQDFDPFADLLHSAPAGPARPYNAQQGDINAPATPKVDDIFQLHTPSSWDPLGPQEPAGRPGNVLPGDLSNDLLAGLGGPSPEPSQRIEPVQRDDAPRLSGAFRAPRPQAEQRLPPQSDLPGSTSVGEPDGASARRTVVSWGTDTSPAASEEIKAVVLPSPKRGQVIPQDRASGTNGAAAPDSVVPTAREVVDQPLRAGNSAASRANGYVPMRAAESAETDELLQAFLNGCGVAGSHIGPITPELMEIFGKLLRESIRGTLELLLARALTKREVRAHTTVIVATENNPLKFSPSVEAALNNLLAPKSQGFMAPAEAMRDAYNDLRSHEIGLMAGMRAALSGVLSRFDPSQLEQRLTRESVISSLLPHSRRAKLWELYEQFYRQILKEAEDDFQTLFGKEFVRAYEAQIEKLEQEEPDTKR